VFVVRLAEDFDRADRDAVLSGLRVRGVACRNYFVPIHLQPFIQERLHTREGQFPVTEQVAKRAIALPFHNHLTESEVGHVVEALRQSIETVCRGGTISIIGVYGGTADPLNMLQLFDKGKAPEAVRDGVTKRDGDFGPH